MNNYINIFWICKKYLKCPLSFLEKLKHFNLFFLYQVLIYHYILLFKHIIYKSNNLFTHKLFVNKTILFDIKHSIILHSTRIHQYAAYCIQHLLMLNFHEMLLILLLRSFFGLRTELEMDESRSNSHLEDHVEDAQ